MRRVNRFIGTTEGNIEGYPVLWLVMYNGLFLNGDVGF